MKFLRSTLFLLLVLCFTIPATRSYGQVASPHNFPHADGSCLHIWGQPLGESFAYTPEQFSYAMGMDGYMVMSLVQQPFQHPPNCLLDDTFHPVLNWYAQVDTGYHYTAINKDRNIWWVSTDQFATRVHVFSQTGVVSSQVRFPGIQVRDVLADTSGHIFMLFGISSSSGVLGLMRFSSGTTPDFVKTYNLPGGMDAPATWGIDQRLYVPYYDKICVFNAQGDMVKRLNKPSSFALHPVRISACQDHGYAIARYDGLTTYITQMDSSLNVVWSRSFQAGPFLGIASAEITRVMPIPLPGSHDVVVMVNVEGQGVPGCATSTRTIYRTIAYLVDANGNMKGTKMLDGYINSTEMLNAISTPKGDPFIMATFDLCGPGLGGYGQKGPSLFLLAGYNLSTACGGVSNYVSGFGADPYTNAGYSYAALSSATLGSVTSTPYTMPLVFGTGSFPSSPSPAASYICRTPCLTTNPTQILGPGLVAFSDNTYGFYNIQYAFGDGTFGTTPDPVHQYPSNGNYSVTVTATNACGVTSATFPAVDPCPSAQIVLPGSACVGVAALFHEGSGLPNDSLAWFVNGTFAGIGDTVLWTPTGTGTFPVKLVYYNSPCIDTASASITVYNASPTSAFTYTLGQSMTIAFTNGSTNGANYLWDFGDGSTTTSANPSHTYATNGPFTICLSAINACATVTSCQTWSCPFPVANFTVTGNGNTATITDQSTNSTTIAWDFGDGTTATGPVTSHVYTGAGTYNVCQTVTNGCATSTICHPVTAIGNGNAYFRIDYSFLGTADPKGVATLPDGTSMIVGGSTAGAFMLIVDQYGGIISNKAFPSVTFAFRDVTAMPNGHFLVVGGKLTGSNSDGLWMEVDATGNVLSNQTVSGTNAKTFTKVKPTPTGGYLLTSTLGGNYVKLNAALSVLWNRATPNSSVTGGFEAPDGTHWIVCTYGNSASTLRFIHLDQNGLDLDEYNALFSAQSSSFYSYRFTEAEMDASGNIYIGIANEEFISGTGSWQKLTLHKFNITSHAWLSSSYTFRAGPTTTPYYDAFPVDLILKPNGNLMLAGYMNLRADIVSSPKQQRLIVDVNPTTLAIAPSDYGSTTAQEQYAAVALQPTGAYLAAGTIDGVLTLHRFTNPTQCQLPNSFQSSLYTTEAPFWTLAHLASPATASIAGGTLSSATLSASPISGLGVIQCTSPCILPLTTSFTYTVSNNVVTFTSSSSSGATVSWTVQGQAGATTAVFSRSLLCNTPTLVTLTASNGCTTVSTSQTITINSSPSTPFLATTLLNNVTNCQSAATAIAAATGYTAWAWSNGATTSSTTVMAPGSINLVAQQVSSGCYFTDTATATIVLPTVSAGSSQTVCPGVSRTFTATAGFTSYLWSNGATTRPITVSTPGTYTVTVTNASGCTNSASVTLSNFPSPVIAVSPANPSVCVGTPVTFTVTSGYNYVWSNGSTASSITVTTPGTYTVTATNLNGCTSVASSVLSNTTLTAGSNQTVCVGTAATFTASSGSVSYVWSNGATTQSISVTTPNTYTVTATDANGCARTASVTLSNYTASTVSIGANQTVCTGANATFTATAGFASYLWSTGATTQSITVSAAAAYTVTVTDANGCTVTATATLSNYTAPTVSIGGNQTVCVGANATFTATAGFSSYLWSNGATTQAISVSTPGSYGVTATDANGCTATASATLSNFSVPSVSIGGNQTVCPGSNATFTATAGFTSYLWSNGATTQAITVSAVGTYSVTATNSNGCTASASATLSNHVTSTPTIAGPAFVCPGASATFIASSGFASYLWSTGATTQSITVSTPGTYGITVTDLNGCMTVGSITLSNFSVPSVSIGGNQTVCTGSNATFTATAGFTSYLWSNGATTQAITVSAVGTYSVTATNSNGCTASASATLSNFSAPSVSIGGNQTVCVGANATFTATAGFTSYLWSNGATTQAITVSTAGTYSVTATNSNGCTATASASLSNFSASSVSIGGNQTVCIGTNATFTATAGFSSYLWSNGATTQAITVSTVGSYSVTATDANGCTATDAATLGNFASASFSLGPDTTFCPDTTWQLNGPSGGSAYAWSTGATNAGIAVATAGTYWLHYIDANGCTAADTIALALSADCVWPGDANHDGIADNQDLLAVGFGFGSTGPTRPNASPNWYGQPAPNWTTALPSLVNYKHPDCDGNGVIDYPDTALIVAHYGLTHNKNTGVTAGVPLFIVPELDSFPAGDTVFFQVHFGDANDLAVNAYGLAYSMHIDPQQITAGTFYARYPNSFLGNGVQDLLTMTYPEQGTGNWHIGISRKDQVGRSGAGGVMRVGFLPDVVYPLTSTLGYVPVRLLNPVAVDGDFNPMLLSAIEDSILIFDPVNAVGQPQGLTHWNLYPVPTAGTAVLEINLSAAMEVDAFLIDMHGRKLRSILNAASLNLGSNKVLVETNDLAEGMYFVRLEIDGRRMVKKLVVER